LIQISNDAKIILQGNRAPNMVNMGNAHVRRSDPSGDNYDGSGYVHPSELYNTSQQYPGMMIRQSEQSPVVPKF